MKKIISLFAAVLFAGSMYAAEPETVPVSIADYASTNSWVNDTKYSSVTIDANVTATVSGTTNTGKYYTNGNEWRLYQTEAASITIATTSGTLSSITITYGSKNTGELKDGDNAVVSGTAVSVSGDSKTFTVGNSSTATNGQVKITAISVTYTPSSDVIVKTLKSIAVTGMTTVYDQYKAFSFDGTCNATYSVTKNDVPQDDEVRAVTPTSVTSPDMTTTGEKEITVSFTDNEVTKTTTYNITVNAHAVTPDTYDLVLANAFWGTSGSGAGAGHTASGEQNDISVSIDGSSGTQNYINDEETRIYGSHTITFSVPTGFVLTKITGLGTDSKSDIEVASGSTGTITTHVWNGSARTVTFQVNGRTDFSTVSVTFAADSGSALDENGVENNAVKVLREGQVLIIKGNKTYNILGQEIK